MSRDSRETLRLRVTPDLKQRVRDYAAQLGVSLNAASAVLLDQALREHVGDPGG